VAEAHNPGVLASASVRTSLSAILHRSYLFDAHPQAAQ